jgi:hypothetical protein
VASESVPMSPEDRALLERIAARVVELRLEVPAILALESVRPLSLVAGQGLIFFQPLAQALFRFRDYERFARLVERRDGLEALTAAIERQVAARPPRRAGPKAAPPPSSGGAGGAR